MFLEPSEFHVWGSLPHLKSDSYLLPGSCHQVAKQLKCPSRTFGDVVAFVSVGNAIVANRDWPIGLFG